MLSSEVIQYENQRFSVNGVAPNSRQTSNKSQSSDLILRGDMSQLPSNNNLVPGTSHLPISNSSSVPSSVQNSGSVYNSYYSSSTFNSVNNFEASLQWLTESRMPNNSLLLDKNLNCANNSHSTPSHSCCVNRLGKVDNIGMCSPLSSDSFRSSRDTASYQTKPPALSVNVMDSVQNWFNLPTLPNQQYNSKLNDQNLNCSQISYPIDQAADLKQAEIIIPDSYFEPSLIGSNSNNVKQMNGNLNELSTGKINDINDMSANLKGQNGYQTNFMSREWKQPLQAANYISSPTLFGALSESPEHYLYSIPPPVSSSSYCMMSNYVGGMTGSKQQQTCGMQQNLEKNNSTNDMRSQQCNEQTHHYKINNQTTLQHPNSNDNKSTFGKSFQFDRNNENLRINHPTNINTVQSYSHNMKDNSDNNAYNTNGKYKPETHYLTDYISQSDNNLLCRDNNRLEQKMSDVSKDGAVEIDDEISSSSDESNIIVEESDETEEIDSVISIEEVKKTFLSEEPVELRCLVCNVKSSTQTPATNFIHMNDSFPLTSASKTPVASKLIQILPVDLQHFLKLHNSFMCRHCLNLIETVEVLEVKLLSVKQTLSENFSKTVQYFLPATPILEIENGKAKIIDKEIIPFIEKTINIESTYSDNTDLVANNKTHKDLTEDVIIQLEDVEEPEDDVFCKEQFEDEEEELKKDEESENIDKESDEEGNFEGKQCSVCSKILLSMRSYKKHMQLHTKNFSFYCEYCGKGFNSKNSLERHIELHNEDNRYQCEKCGKTYTQKQRLADHLKKHLGEFKMNCAECGKGFMDKTELQLHMQSHIKLQQYICEICGSKFVKKSNLKNHLQICKKEEIKCNSCSEVFYSKTHLKKHEVMNHGAKPSTECNICGKTFVNCKDLKPHMRSHSQDKPFECELCGKRYKSVGNLNHHSKIHNIDKLLNCKICGEGFQRKKYLEYHMNKHSGEHVYKCSECDKGFFSEKNMLNHMKIHSSTVKTKTCPICSKNVHHSLQVHMRTHTGVKPYVCNHCSQAFSVNSALNRHIQSKHSNVLET